MIFLHHTPGEGNMVRGEIEAALARAEAHFNAGEYRQALEEFEAVYHHGPPERRELHLGLVRAAAALHHRQQGHPHSARRLLSSAREILGRWAEDRETPWTLARLVADLDGLAGVETEGPLPRLSRRT